MKKSLFAILLCMTILTACKEKDTLTMPFSVTEIASVRLYKVSDGEISVEKNLTEEDAITDLYNRFTDIEIETTKKVHDDSYVVFHFILLDNTNYDIVYYGHSVKNGTLKVGEKNYYFVTADFNGIWEDYIREAY